MTSASIPAISIAVLTYRRESLLPALVTSLTDELAAVRAPTGSEVLVVDNDPQASARATVEHLEAARYVLEDTPGIAAARQRALDEIPADHLLVFIDDDELPVPGWLGLLIRAWEDHGRPAGVAGRVVPKFEAEPEQWVVDGRFFERTLAPTGTEVAAAGAGNLLLDAAQVATLGLRFDQSLGFRGGEDTLFTRQLTRAGGRLIRCREAEAYDLVPPERATRRWVLRRAFSQAGAAARVEVALNQSIIRRAWVRLRLLLGGVARIPAGAVWFVAGWATRSPYSRARGPWLMMRGAGLAAGGVGFSSQEYKRK